MVEEKSPHIIENWSIHQVEAEIFTTNIIVGEMNGQEIKTDTIFWLDSEKKIAMTKNNIYRLGRPHSTWYSNLVSAGYKLKDLDIKGTTH